MALKYYPLIELEEIPENGRVFIEIDHQSVVVMNVQGTIYALGDTCPHDGGSIGDGDIEDGEIICPIHGARFCLADGKAVPNSITNENIPWYPARVVEGMIEIGVEESINE